MLTLTLRHRFLTQTHFLNIVSEGQIGCLWQGPVILMIGAHHRMRNWALLIFLFTTASRTALGPTQPPIQWVPGALSLGIERAGREADHSPPSSADVKNAWSYTYTSPIRLHGVVLSQKHRNNFTFTFLHFNRIGVDLTVYADGICKV
jgi:hypothetical protein